MGARIRSDMRCVHCNTTETPLWRAGPAGPKTLCNACGVRWKKTGSVIPRAKRPSTTPPSAGSSDHHANGGPSSNLSSTVRKRARVADPSSDAAEISSSHLPPTNLPQQSSASDSRSQAANAAQASLPAPKPVSVFRVADAGRSKYESVFSGLMVVHRPAQQIDEASPRGRTRTQTTRGHAFFSEFAAPPTLALPCSPPAPQTHPCSSPSPTDRGQDDKDEKDASGVYVTEVHAPSPSPSPPPMPRVQRRGEGGGFTLMLAAGANERKPPV